MKKRAHCRKCGVIVKDDAIWCLRHHRRFLRLLSAVERAEMTLEFARKQLQVFES